MRFLALAAACLLPLARAQDTSRSSSSATSSASASSSISASPNQTVITTTITSLIASGSASPSPSVIVLTLTLNSTSPSATASALTNATLGTNGSLSSNSTGNATVWKEGDDWIPFPIAIDPAYGVLGAVLILSGIPVAVLGGKNRCVQPNIQPPSPNPPTQTLRGLYLLASLISAIIGGGIGIFLWKLAKYWVSAAGGFAFGWFLLALRPGGLITNVLGRWGLLGGLTVGAFVASLPEVLNPWMMLVGTAWIGATAFMLGVDCYTRAGLKEFYIYNLGFWDLYASLGGAKYPLTQTMSIQLGILGAVVIIGAAIQFRVLNILQKRIKQLKDEEEAREDAADVSKAAERFKNLSTEQTEWEEKYGSGSGSGPGPAESPGIPQLDFDPRRPSSQMSLLSQKRSDGLPLRSPTIGETQMSRSGSSPVGGGEDREVMRDELRSPFLPHSRAGSAAGLREDDEIESKLRVLEEVRQARMSIRSSLDVLRAQTPGGGGGGGGGGSLATTPTSTHFGDDRLVRHSSGTSGRMLEPTFEDHQARPRSDWERYASERRIITPTLPSPASLGPATRPMSHRQSSYDPIYENPQMDRRERTTSMLEPRVSDFGARRQSGYEAYAEPLRRTESANGLARPVSAYDTPSASFTPTAPSRSGPPPNSRVITGSASQSFDAQPRQSMQRTMTYEELSDRHRRRISKLQDPVSSKMNEEVALAHAKEKWERQKRAEKEEMRRREAERMLRQKEREREAVEAAPRPTSVALAIGGGRLDGTKKAEEWRRSIGNGLNVMAGPEARSGRNEGQVGQGTEAPRSRRMSSHLAN